MLGGTGAILLVLTFSLLRCSKKKLKFMYGKWTEIFRVTDPQSYEDYLKENAHKFR